MSARWGLNQYQNLQTRRRNSITCFCPMSADEGKQKCPQPKQTNQSGDQGILVHRSHKIWKRITEVVWSYAIG